MNRTLTPEWLDALPANTREAIDSRRDLRRLNAFLRQPSFVAEALLASFPSRAPERIVELGAGDGVFALRMASRLAKRWRSGHLVLVDRRPAASDSLQRDFERVGWTVEIATADVFDWLEQNDAEAAVANLFLHHFEGARLEQLLRLVANKAKAVVACEPRRSLLPFYLTHLLGLAGCNAVTRHDAPISVQAGFRGDELTALWPKSDWKVAEQEVGLFSHLFVAHRCK
jgi:hypothetical protein